MKVLCPHCSQRIALDEESIESMRGTSSFTCPACEGQIPLTGPPSHEPIASQDKHRGPHWTAPDVQEMERNFDSRYKIQRILGRGGMGAVYEGFDTRLDRRVAIKILPPDAGKDVDALARFEREAKAMAALDHPNIVKIHDFGQTLDGNPFLIMEFIDGMDIHALRQGGHLDLPGALELISQVCSALQFAHNRGIIHRDIKPANIMVSREGVAKVTDFGLARMLGTEDLPNLNPTLTRSGTAMGTPDYMAPEQMEGLRVDHRADIYSLGIMLYDLLTGSPPRGAWPPPSQRVQIDVRLDEIVLRALQHNPSARYQAAGEVRDDIDSVKSTTGGGPLPPGTDPEPLPSSRKIPVGTAARPTTSAPGGNGRSRKFGPPDAAEEIIASTRGLNTTMFILGLLAIALIGSLALYLANRKSGDSYQTETTISNSETNNTYFTQLIALGFATEKELAAIQDIRPYEGGLIGLSKESMTWKQAHELAGRTGGKMLDVAVSAPTWPALLALLNQSFPALATSSVWLLDNGQARILNASEIVVPASPHDPSPDLRHKVLLHWQPGILDPPSSIQPSQKSEPDPGPSTNVHDPKSTLPPVSDPSPEKQAEPEPPPGPVAWTDIKGKTILAEFVRVSGASVVIRKDSKEFTIPFAKLSPASIEQARKLAAESH